MDSPEERASPGVAVHRLWGSRTTAYILRIAVRVVFVALAARFLMASFFEAPSARGAEAVLTLGSAGLGFWMPAEAAFAFGLGFVILGGTSLAALLATGAGPTLVLCAVILGGEIRQLLGGRIRYLMKSRPEPAVAPGWDRWISAAADLFAMGIAGSLFWALRGQWSDPAFWRAIAKQSEFGFGSAFYPLTAAFNWIQGVRLFQALGDMDRRFVRQLLPVGFVVWIAATVGFFILQFCLHVPYPLEVWAYEGKKFHYAYSSPFEDMHSFGTFLVTALAFLLVWPWKSTRWTQPGLVVATSCLVALLIGSFSRAAWVTGIGVLLGWSYARLGRRTFLAILGVLLGCSLYVNFGANIDRWNRDSYLHRLLTLVRLETPQAKMASRLEVYGRAMRMIAAHPFGGSGVGTFFLRSPAYAQPGGDLTPNFAHDFALQIAAESGVPLALLFVAIIGGCYAVGWRDRRARSLAAALAAFLLTQLTSNSLNIFIQDQFLFWILVAGIVAFGYDRDGRKGAAARSTANLT